LEFKDTRSNRRGVADQLRTLIRKAHELADDADPAALNQTPPGGGWSAAQCLEHINETARVYLPVLASAIEEGRSRKLLARVGGGDGRTLLGRLIVWSQEPPVRFRVRTVEMIRPPDGPLDPIAVMEDFEALHEELIVRINESGSLDRKRIRVPSVLKPLLKLSLGDWFAFLAAHARRHLWQAERALTAARDRSAD
jgi:hypothetical protein